MTHDFCLVLPNPLEGRTRNFHENYIYIYIVSSVDLPLMVENMFISDDDYQSIIVIVTECSGHFVRKRISCCLS